MLRQWNRCNKTLLCPHGDNLGASRWTSLEKQTAKVWMVYFEWRPLLSPLPRRHRNFRVGWRSQPCHHSWDDQRCCFKCEKWHAQEMWRIEWNMAPENPPHLQQQETWQLVYLGFLPAKVSKRPILPQGCTLQILKGNWRLNFRWMKFWLLRRFEASWYECLRKLYAVVVINVVIPLQTRVLHRWTLCMKFCNGISLKSTLRFTPQ